MGGPRGASHTRVGASHTRVGATYTSTCLECRRRDLKAVYDGETGRSGYYRTTKGHKNDILENKTDKSALAKHTGLFHRDKVGDPSIYQLKVNNTTKSSLLRQVREGQSIIFFIKADQGLEPLHRPRSFKREER